MKSKRTNCKKREKLALLLCVCAIRNDKRKRQQRKGNDIDWLLTICDVSEDQSKRVDKRESRLGKTRMHCKLRREQETFEEREARLAANRLHRQW